MAQVLTEKYRGRLAISEKLYAQTNGGARMSSQKKLVTAMCIDNVAKFLNESWANSTSATQKGDLGKYKQFCLDITTVVVPNLIVNELFITFPLPSFQGYMTY